MESMMSPLTLIFDPSCPNRKQLQQKSDRAVNPILIISRYKNKAGKLAFHSEGILKLQDLACGKGRRRHLQKNIPADKLPQRDIFRQKNRYYHDIRFSQDMG